jgi:hypothetical protein
MAKRRQFVLAFVGVAVVMLLACGLWPRGVAIEEGQAQTILRLWLAVDYRGAVEDPALRGPESASSVAQAHETAPIAFKQFELCRPFIKPFDAARAALVRAEITYSDLPPPDGESVRYFLLVEPKSGAQAGVWQVRREVSQSAWRWRLGF